MGFMDDMLKNPNQHYSTTKVMRFGCYVLGCVFGVASVAGGFFGKLIDFSPAVYSWSIALGADALQSGKAWLDRKTADANGNPLAVPGTTEPPAEPQLMPQAPTAETKAEAADQEAAAAEAI